MIKTGKRSEKAENKRKRKKKKRNQTHTNRPNTSYTRKKDILVEFLMSVLRELN